MPPSPLPALALAAYSKAINNAESYSILALASLPLFLFPETIITAMAPMISANAIR
jgi:hypothetical protein